MQNKKRASTLALLSAATLSLGFMQPWQEPVLKDADHKKIGKEVAAYWDATDAKKDIQKSFEKLSDTIEKSQKKVKDQDILALTADWEAIFGYASIEGLKDKTKKGRVTTEEMSAPFGEVSVAYHAPKKYSPKRGFVPLLLVVPKPGTEAEEYIEAEWADEALRETAVIAVVDMGDADEWGGQPGVYAVMSNLSAVKSAFAVDVNRIFLAGSGEGFAAAAATASAFPQLFAGLIGLGEIPVVPAANFRSIPTFVNAESEGATSLSAQIGHLEFGNFTLAAGAPLADLWAWAEAQTRNPYPEKLSFSPRFSFAQAAHWLKVDGVNYEAQPHLEAVVDRAANTITIDAAEIASIQVYFNDALVDLSSPVNVVVNGAAHEQTVTRNRRTMIDNAYRQGDWGRVFSSFASFDVPLKEGQKETAE